mmetsp:Transcript_12947/g.29218  ORF Transcript_12947/g.29218 Transcript_12947/m.29218 type:complete len:214 (-) Transcript_12947:1931-2572(-)
MLQEAATLRRRTSQCRVSAPGAMLPMRRMRLISGSHSASCGSLPLTQRPPPDCQTVLSKTSPSSCSEGFFPCHQAQLPLQAQVLPGYPWPKQTLESLLLDSSSSQQIRLGVQRALEAQSVPLPHRRLLYPAISPLRAASCTTHSRTRCAGRVWLLCQGPATRLWLGSWPSGTRTSLGHPRAQLPSCAASWQRHRSNRRWTPSHGAAHDVPQCT